MEKDLVPITTDRFLVRLFNENGERVVSQSLINGFSDEPGNMFCLKISVVEDIFTEIYGKFEEGVCNLKLSFLKRNGDKDWTFNYKDLELKSVSFDELNWENDSECLNFYFEFSYEDKSLLKN